MSRVSLSYHSYHLFHFPIRTYNHMVYVLSSQLCCVFQILNLWFPLPYYYQKIRITYPKARHLSLSILMVAIAMGRADGTCQNNTIATILFAFPQSPTSFVPSCASATTGKAEIRGHTCDTPSNCSHRIIIHPTILSVQYARHPKGPRSAIQAQILHS